MLWVVLLFFGVKFLTVLGGRFRQADIHDSEVAHDMLTALMDKIASGGSPEKVSENDYLMKCACGCMGGGAVADRQGRRHAGGDHGAGGADPSVPGGAGAASGDPVDGQQEPEKPEL